MIRNRSWASSSRNMLLAVGLSVGLVGHPASLAKAEAPAVPPRPVKIMAMGDSTTEGSSNSSARGSWRDDFYRKMLAAEYSNGQNPGAHFDMVGTNSSTKPHDILPYDPHSQAFGSHSIQNLYERSILGIAPAAGFPSYTPGPDADWSAFGAPDVVMLLVGALDVSRINGGSDYRTADTLAESIEDLKDLLAGLRSRNPNVAILLSTPIPSTASGRLGPTVSMEDLKDLLVAAYQDGEFDAPGSPIYLVDQWTHFDTTTMLGDGTHPSPTGQDFIATNYFDALVQHDLLIPEPASMNLLALSTLALLARHRERSPHPA